MLPELNRDGAQVPDSGYNTFLNGSVGARSQTNFDRIKEGFGGAPSSHVLQLRR